MAKKTYLEKQEQTLDEGFSQREHFKTPVKHSHSECSHDDPHYMIKAARRKAEKGTHRPMRFVPFDAFLAYHFMEHLTKADIITVLTEVQRCLKPGGVFNVVVPHFSSEAAHQDLDHKSFWTESTWKNLFKNPYYEGTMPRKWKLREHQTVLMGLVQRNLVVVSQLVKVEA